MGKRLYVGNLPYDADEDAIRTAFSEGGGTVERVHIPLDRETQRPRGFAFVEMGSEQEAQQAASALNGTMLGTRTLRVSEAEDRRPAGGGPGRSGVRPDRSHSGAGGYRGGGDRDGPRSDDRSSGAAGEASREAGGARQDPAERAREARERRFGPDARPGRDRDRGQKGKRGHGRRRHEDSGGGKRGGGGGGRYDDYDY